MALSILPTVAWDLTSATTPLLAKAGEALTLSQTGGTLNSSGFTVTANNNFLDTTATAPTQTATMTVVLCVTTAADIPPYINMGGIYNDTGSQWAAALLTWDDSGSTVYVGRIGGSIGGRYSSQVIGAVTEAVIVCTLGPSVAKIWFNGSLVLNGTPASITYGAANRIELNRVGTNSGTTMKYAAFYDAEPSGADITALGSNAASAYTAIFGGGPAVAKSVFPFFLR